MFWIVLLQIIICFLHRASAGDGYIASPTGPQSAVEAHLASAALHGNYFGGDMLFPDGMNISYAGRKDERYRWRKVHGLVVVPYLIDDTNERFRSVVLAGMEQYHDSTCIWFVPRTMQTDYVRIFQGNGCYSFVGRKGGKQDLSLGPGCHYVGLVVHELGHAIGLFHEHQRSDRDKYINVFTDNVLESKIHNFDKKDPRHELIFHEYDYHSIMHYGNYAFSFQRNIYKTMEAKNGTPLREPYEKPGFDENDIEAIQKLYNC